MPKVTIELLELTDTFETWKNKFNSAITSINDALDEVPNIDTLAPKNHANSATTYGIGTNALFGHVKLSDATNGTQSVTNGIAATPKAVKTAFDKANSAYTKATTIATATTVGIVKPGAHMTVDDEGALTVTAGTTSAPGIVQLTNAVNSTATNIAATAKAVKTAYDKANTIATTTVLGNVKVGTSLTINTAGLLNVSLNNTVTSTSTVQAATANAVKLAYDKAIAIIPVGTKMLFHQAAAPTGWTKQRTVNDATLRVVSGTTGGGTGGSVAFSTLFAAGKAVTLSGNVGATTLTANQGPKHYHRMAVQVNVSDMEMFRLYANTAWGAPPESALPTDSGFYEPRLTGLVTHYTGGSQSHTHTLSGKATIALNVKYTDVIICAKA